MRPVTEVIDIRSTVREQCLELTEQVAALVRRAGIETGLAVVFCPHTTAGVMVQENADPTVKSDLLGHLRHLIPQDPAFQHDEGNADAHIKSALVGVSTTLLIDQGRLVLGRWQGLYFCEFDGPRSRQLIVRIQAA